MTALLVLTTFLTFAALDYLLFRRKSRPIEVALAATAEPVLAAEPIFVALVQPAVKGLHWFEPTWLYVHRGTGTWGPPMRLGNPAEITVVELTRA